MRLLDLCKPTCTTSTRGFVRLPLSGERSEEALDGAPSASVSRARSPRRSEGRAPLGTVLRERSFERRAVWDGVFGRSRGEGSASDTLCRARCRSSLRTTLPGARTAAPAPLVKEGGASRSSAPFHRRRAPSTPACAGASGAARRLPAIDTIPEHDRVDPTGPRPERVRLPSPAGAWRQRSCEHRRPALLGPGGRERLSPHRPRPGNAWRSYPETDPCRAPRFMSPSRRRLENRLRAASPPLGTRPPVEPRLRRIPRRTRRTACAGAPARGLRLVRITYRGSSAVPPPRRGSPARCTQGAFRPMKRTRSAPGLPTDCHQPVE